MNPKSRSRAEPRKSSPPLVAAWSSAGDVGRALEHRGQRLAGVRAQVDDRLPGVEALDEQQVNPRLRELAGRRRATEMDAEHPVAGVRVVGDVERPVADRDDRGAVDDRRALEADERAVARSGDRTGLSLSSGNPLGPGVATRVGLKSGAPAKSDDPGPEVVVARRRVLELDRLHAIRASDPDVRELRRIVDAEVVRQPRSDESSRTYQTLVPSGALPGYSGRRTLSLSKSTCRALSTVSFSLGEQTRSAAPARWPIRCCRCRLGARGERRGGCGGCGADGCDSPPTPAPRARSRRPLRRPRRSAPASAGAWSIEQHVCNSLLGTVMSSGPRWFVVGAVGAGDHGHRTQQAHELRALS